MKRSLRAFAVFATSTLATSATGWAQTPPRPGNTGFPATMSVADRRQILQVANFDLSADLRNATRYCDDKKVIAKVGIGRRDINNDSREEFFVLSQNECPGDNGKIHAAIVFFDSNTRLYQNMLDVDGQPKIGAQSGTDWPQIDVTDGDKTTSYAFVARDSRYLPLSTIAYRKNLALARQPERTPPSQLPTASWTRPWNRGDLTPGQLAQIFLAAGYKQTPDGWKGCDGTSDAEIPDAENAIVDLNGDGNPEVIVRDDSAECYGNSGGRFTVLSPVPGGWKKVGEGQDIPFILENRSRAGWLDYEEGGPGFCHARDRNDGQGYRSVGQIADSPNGCSGS
ncbi:MULTISPECIES: hypothetical protein [unclassified Novosphingobium]|uniref:hypothetical protein n=1 Tax=unclassified Novosphingobium TaxID=2644732 RepID=UPI00146F934B|nr:MULTISPECIES: hypothetical protein [unclassified Novosphingobium]NMN04857.1 hypothetical protein [Novosphingobium sp. SG919]NMN85149.1 hypothetical protein [Novosphingobium sp. SG916]